jgi:hypothetical protein
MDARRPALFLSYQSLTMKLAWGWIDQEDLDSGLFYLNCMPEFATTMNDSAVKEIALWKCVDPRIDPEKMFHRVEQALCLAQAQKRAIWRELYTYEDKKTGRLITGATWGCNRQLDTFLAQHGIPSQLQELEQRFSRGVRIPAWGAKTVYDRPLSTFEWYWLLERKLVLDGKQELLRVIW